MWELQHVWSSWTRRESRAAYFLVGLGSEGLPGVGAGTDIGPPLSTKNVTNIRACRAEGLVDL